MRTAFDRLGPSAGAAKIVVKNPDGAIVETLQLGRSAPIVAIVASATGLVGSRAKNVSWTITRREWRAYSLEFHGTSVTGLHPRPGQEATTWWPVAPSQLSPETSAQAAAGASTGSAFS